jgi:hypothetical protein
VRIRFDRFSCSFAGQSCDAVAVEQQALAGIKPPGGRREMAVWCVEPVQGAITLAVAGPFIEEHEMTTSKEDTVDTPGADHSASAHRSAMADLLERVQAILLRPGSAWAEIAAEHHSIAQVYKSYVVFLAAIPAIAGFIGFSLVGVGTFGISVRVPLVEGLVGAVVSYLLTLVMAMVLAWVANWLAPRFGGQAQLPRAFQLIAYGATAGWLGGIFSAIPSMAMLGVLAGLYSIYLIYRGVPVLMQVPQEKSLGYTVALIVCAVVAAMVVSLASSLFVSRPGGLGGLGVGGGQGRSSGQGADISVTLPGTEIRIDTAKVEAASRRIEEANARGDSQEARKALDDVMSAALGGKGGKPVPPETFRAMLPDTLGGMTRTALDARVDVAMGVQFTNVSAQYTEGDQLIEVRMQDVGAVPVLALGMTAWARGTADSETAEGVERVYQRDGVAYREKYRKDGTSATLAILLPNGILLEGNGNVPMDALRSALQAIPLAKISALQR